MIAACTLLNTLNRRRGHCFRVWREHRGLTQMQLAEAAGVTQSMVAMIERGDRRGTVDTLTVIARALKTDLEDIASGSTG